MNEKFSNMKQYHEWAGAGRIRRARTVAIACVAIAGLPPAVQAQDKKPPATQPAATQPAPADIDKVLDELAKMDPKTLQTYLGKLQESHKKLGAESEAARKSAAEMQKKAAELQKQAAALQAQAAEMAKKAQAVDAQLNALKKRIDLLTVLVNKPTTQPAAKPKAAAPAKKPAMAAKPPAMKPKGPAQPAAMKPKPEAKAKAEPKVKIINFQEHIKPMLENKCGKCHSQDRAKGGLVVETFPALMEGGGSGKVIVPGDPDASRLWRLVNHEEEPSMPPRRPKLPDDALALIRTWIELGALPDANAKPMAPKPKKKMKIIAAVPQSSGPIPMPANAPKKLAPPTRHATAATAVAASPVAPLLAVCGHRQITIHDVDKKGIAAALPFPEGRIQHLQFSADGKWLVAAGGLGGKEGKVVIFDVVSGKRLGEVGKTYDIVLAAAVDPYRELVAVGGATKTVRVYDLLTGEMAYEIEKHNDFITAVAFSPDATLLATADRSGGLFVWEAVTGRDVHLLRGHSGAIQDLAFRPDSAILASTGDDGTLQMWEMEKGGRTKRVGVHGVASLSLDYAPDGRIVTSGADGLVKLWKIDGGAVRNFENLGDWAYDACFINAGKLVAAGAWNGQVTVFETETGKKVWQITTNPKPDDQLAKK